TGLDPAMTLGCGGYGGNITSDNISPRHLLNIKRLAYEVSPVVSRWDRPGVGSQPPAPEGVGSLRLPSAPVRPPAPTGISAEALSRRIDDFLGQRGFRPGSDRGQTGVRPGSDPGLTPVATPRAADQTPLTFVCEDDVRQAIQSGRKLVVSERAIVTPPRATLGDRIAASPSR